MTKQEVDEIIQENSMRIEHLSGELIRYAEHMDEEWVNSTAFDLKIEIEYLCESIVEYKNSFSEWYEELRCLAGIHNVSVADRHAWREAWADGKSPREAMLNEYPEIEEEEE